MLDAALELITSIPMFLEFVIILAAAVAGFYALKKTVYKPIKAHFKKINDGMDTLLGYPPVLDPGTGREIQPATPKLAERVYALEQTHQQVADAITTMADIQKQMLERNKHGDAIVAEWTQWREGHELEAKEREARIHEWEQWRSEQAQMWEFVRTNMAIEGTKKITETHLDAECAEPDSKPAPKTL